MNPTERITRSMRIPPTRAGTRRLMRLLCLPLLTFLLTAGAWQVLPARDFTEAFRRTQGWSGADGTYSVPLLDGRTLWLFGDTFFGGVLPGGQRSPETFMARNSVALQPGREPRDLQFFAEPFHLERPGRHDEWFWPYHGVPIGSDRVQVLLGRFRAIPRDDAFGFRQVGLDLAVLRLEPAPRMERLSPVPHFRSTPDSVTAWGNALVQEGPWTLIYGVRDSQAAPGGKSLLLARAPRGHLARFGTWRFFTGEGWSRDPEEAAILAEDVSNELSVHRDREGQWVLVSGPADLSSRVLLRTAPTPHGPWSPAQNLLTAPEAADGVFAYNAKAHPSLSDPSGLLISYNLNALEPERVIQDADLYRPRFIRVRLEPGRGCLPESRRAGPIPDREGGPR